MTELKPAAIVLGSLFLASAVYALTEIDGINYMKNGRFVLIQNTEPIPVAR